MLQNSKYGIELPGYQSKKGNILTWKFSIEKGGNLHIPQEKDEYFVWF